MRRARTCILVCAFAFALASAGCGSDTRVDVYFEAEEGVAADAVELEVIVTNTEGRAVLARKEALGGGRALPLGVRLEPAGGDASRSFFVVGYLLNDAGAPIARVARGGRYVDGEALELRLRFTGDCAAGLECTGTTSCGGGMCVSVCDSGIPACDAAPGDGGVSPEDGGGVDGGGTDGGAPHVPAYVERSEAGSFEVDATERAWLVMASGSIAATGAGTGTARLFVDGTEMAVGTSAGAPWSAFTVLAAGATRTVEVSVEPSGTGVTATIEDLHVVAFPLPAETAVHSDVQLGNRLILQSEGWRSVATLPVPEGTGRHLVLAAVSATPAPAVDTVGVRVVDASGGFWPVAGGTPPHLGGAGTDTSTFFLARAPTLAAGSGAQFTLEVRAGSPSSNVSHAQVVAIALDRFDATFHAEELAAGTTSSSTPVPLASRDVSAADAPRDYLFIGSVSLLASGTRGAVLRAGDEERRYTHALDASARLSYPYFTALSTDAAFTASVAAFAAGTPVEHREAVVHVLGL